MKWPRLVPDQWPAVLFGISLAGLALALLLQHAPISEYLCSSDEKLAPCARNWWNALANILTAVVAGLAAVYAYNQYIIAKTQTRLPLINLQIADCKRLHQAITAALRAYINLSGNTWNVFILKSGGVDEEALRLRVAPVVANIDALEEARTVLLGLENEIDLDSKYRDMASEARNLLYVDAVFELRQVMHYLREFQKERIGLGGADMMLAEAHSARALSHMKSQLSAAQAILIEANAMIAASLEEKRRVMAVSAN